MIETEPKSRNKPRLSSKQFWGYQAIREASFITARKMCNNEINDIH